MHSPLNMMQSSCDSAKETPNLRRVYFTKKRHICKHLGVWAYFPKILSLDCTLCGPEKIYLGSFVIELETVYQSSFINSII